MSSSGRAPALRSRQHNHRRLRFESLEDRRLLAILTVNTLADGLAPGDGFVTLREAVLAANTDGVTDLGEVGLGPDSIIFDPALSGGTIFLFPFLGTIPISSDLEIDASGLADSLSINAGFGFDLLPGTADGFRVFTIDDLVPGATVPVELVGLTLTGGDTPLGFAGAAIYNAETLTIDDCLITGNISAGDGGAIFNADGALTILNSTITGNMAGAGFGGGIGSVGPASSIAIMLSTISDNFAGITGGGISSLDGSVTITSSTLSGNDSIGDGGGLFKAGPVAPLTIETSTFYDNSSDMDGGAIWAMNAPGIGTLVTNCTISGNSADDDGGGIYAVTPGASTFTIEHSTITENICDTDGDLIGAGGGLFAIGAAIPVIDHTILAANLLGPLPAGPFIPSDIGGPAIVAASYSLVGIDTTGTIINFLLTSIIGVGIPIGPGLAPLAFNGGPTLTHRLMIASPAIDSGDPAFLPPPASDQRGAPFVRVFDGDGDFIPVIDIGAYELQSLPGPAPIVVDSLVDENDGDYSVGDLSLREAIGLANGSVGVIDTIMFAPPLSGGTIVLDDLLGELPVIEAVTITASGLPANVAISAGNGADDLPATGDGYRIFNIEFTDPAAIGTVELSNLTLTSGDVTGPGGAIRSIQMLTVSDCLVTGNAASGPLGFGGGIYAAGPLTSIFDTAIVGNTITGAGASGGGIAAEPTGTLLVERTTIAGNSTTGAGSSAGGIWAAGPTSIFNSTISGNSTVGDGGGILDASTLDPFSITLSTISGNSAGILGGGLATSGGGPPLSITHSTITANTATVDGGGISATALFGGIVLLDHTIVADNTALGGPTPDINKVPVVGGTISANYSLIGEVIPGAVLNVGGTSLIGLPLFPIDPMLGPLAANGGPTLTHDLLPGSPAIEAGDPSASGGLGGVPVYDQRGVPWTRVYDSDGTGSAIVDIGAYELHATTPSLPTLLGDYNLNSVVDAADYVLWRKTLGTSGLTAYSGADGDGDGTIDNDDLLVWRANFGNVFPGAGSGAQNATPNEPVTGASAAQGSSVEPVSNEAPAFSSPVSAVAGNAEAGNSPDWPSTLPSQPAATSNTASAKSAAFSIQVPFAGLPFWAADRRASESQPSHAPRSNTVVREPLHHDVALEAWLATHTWVANSSVGISNSKTSSLDENSSPCDDDIDATEQAFAQLLRTI